jgi:UDP-glucose 4-epimerase
MNLGSEPKRVLITGSSGFIGSHLVDTFSLNGYLVTGWDKVPYPYSRPANFHSVVDDLANLELMLETLGNQDLIVHLAAKPSVPDSWNNPFESIQQNAANSARLFKLCAELNKPIYVASSSSVYGLKGTKENPYQPISPYGVSKAAMEMLFSAYQKQRGLRGAIFRFFNVFGPRHRLSVANPPVIAKLMECAKRGVPFTLEGDGLQSRDFTFVRDLANVIYLICNNRSDFSEPLELSFGQPQTLLGIIEMIEEISGIGIKRQVKEARIGDIKFSKANGSLDKAISASIVATPLSEALLQTWNWHLSL